MNQDNTRPLVSFILVAYNQNDYVKQAIESALAQTYRPIQFIFSDDCSTDSSYEIIKEAAARFEGTEDIILNRNDQNLGVVDHLNKLIFEYAKGKYYVFQAGDDISTADRTEKIVACFEATGASAVAVNPMMIDENGHSTGIRLYSNFPRGVLNFEDFFVKGAAFFGAGGYASEIFSTYGPMKKSARNEDRILPFRASTLNGIAYLEAPVYFYREHGKNMSFWVKMKRDPLNSSRYEIASKLNELQNIANFKQEVRSSYKGQDKDEILKKIKAKYKQHLHELALTKLGIFHKLVLIIAAVRKGRDLKEGSTLLLLCVAPRLFR